MNAKFRTLEQRSKDGCAESSLFLGDLYMGQQRGFWFPKLTDEYGARSLANLRQQRRKLEADETKALNYWKLATTQDVGRIRYGATKTLSAFYLTAFEKQKKSFDLAEAYEWDKKKKEKVRTTKDKARSVNKWREMIRSLPELEQALRNKAIRLVKSTWIVDLAFGFDTVKCVPPCQEIPEDAFFSYKELTESHAGDTLC